MNLKKSLKIAMVNKDIDQKELSALSGVNESTLSQTITGKSSPNTKTIEKLAKGLGISYAELILLGE